MQNDTPYKGLMPYDESDADFFFGREKERKLITANLMASRLTVLYGPSGVGKSSVLRAGVISHLRKLDKQNRTRNNASKFIVLIYNCWSDDPLHGLINSIEDAVRQIFPLKSAKPAGAPAPKLTENLMALSQSVRDDFSTDLDIFVILDQVEEYFLYPQRTGVGTFEHEFPLAVNQPNLRVNFLLSLRSDWLASLDRFKGPLPNLFDNSLRINRLDREAARSAIIKPVKKYNEQQAGNGAQAVLFLDEKGEPDEKGFADEVLDELELFSDRVGLVETSGGIIPRQNGSDETKKRIQTPYLQLVMKRLWYEAINGDHTLRKGLLKSLGGAEPIVQQHLKGVMSTLQPEEKKEIAASVFHYLVTPSGTKIAQKVSDLSDYTNIPEEKITPVLTELSDKDNSILTQVAPAPEKPDVPRYEIFHDVLASAILEWRKEYQKGRDEKKIEEKEREQRKLEQTKWLRWSVAILSILLLIMGYLAYVAIKNSSEANRKASDAIAAENTALSRELAVSSNMQLEIDPELSLLLATKAVETSATAEAIYALRKSLLKSRLRATLSGHMDSVTRTAFSPDGRLVATASTDKTARVWATATGKAVAVFQHDGPLQELVFSPDSRLLAVETGDGKGKVWDVESQQEVFELTELNGPKAALAFSPDGKRLVTETRGTGYGAKVWDVAARKELYQLRGNPVSSIAFSPDGKWMATTSVNDADSLGVKGDKAAQVWDTATGRLVTRLQRSAAASVSNVAFSADAKLILTYGGEDSTVSLWETGTWRPRPGLENKLPVFVASFSPDNRLVLTISRDVATPEKSGSNNYVAIVWDTATGRFITQYTGRAVNAAFSPDSKFIVSSSDSSAQIWVATTGKIVAELRGHNGRINSVQFSPDQKWLVTASDDMTARLWDVSSLPEVLSYEHPVTAMAFSPDGQLIAASNGGPSFFYREFFIRPRLVRPKNPTKAEQEKLIEENRVAVWNITNRKLVAELRGHITRVLSIAYSSEGNRIITTSADGTAKIWDLKGSMLANLQHNEGKKEERVIAARFSPDERTVFSVSKSTPDVENNSPVKSSPENSIWTVWNWDVNDGHLISKKTIPAQPINSAAFSPDASLLVTTSGNIPNVYLSKERRINDKQNQKTEQAADNVAIIWSTSTWQPLHKLEGHTEALTDAKFSADAKFIITSSSDKTARLWKLDPGKQVLTESLMVFEHPDAVTAVSFNRDGEFVVTSGVDNVVRIWEARTGQLVAEIDSFGSRVQEVSFSRNGNMIAAASQDKSVQIYNCEVCAPVDSLSALARSRISREFTPEESKKYLRRPIQQ